MQQVTVQTNANVALIKYWGKRNEQLLLPTKNSLSITLSALTTTTTVTHTANNRDEISINWQTATEVSHKTIIDFIDLFRTTYNIQQFFAVTTHNNFPTAAGLASSASGFAALAIALSSLCKLNVSKKELSILARQGSGSACRSLHGGFVLWHKGENSDGTDSYAEQIFDEQHWPELRILVIVVKNDAKKVSSRVGMRITTDTSPTYQSWIEKSAQRIPSIIDALGKKDFERVGTLVEADWADMQQAMLDSQPQLDYWTPTSHEVMKSIHKIRSAGVSCYFTTDAGPNIKLICLEENVQKIMKALQSIDGVLTIIPCKVAEAPIVIIKK